MVPPDSLFVRTVKGNLEGELGKNVDLILGRSVADTNHFAVHGGVPTIICGPSGGNTCEANEYVDLSSLPVIARDGSPGILGVPNFYPSLTVFTFILLEQFISEFKGRAWMNLERHIAGHDEDVKQVVLRISEVAKKISRGFATRRGVSDSSNVYGEQQQAMDVWAQAGAVPRLRGAA